MTDERELEEGEEPSPEDFEVEDLEVGVPAGPVSHRSAWKFAAVVFLLMSVPPVGYACWTYERWNSGEKWPVVRGTILDGENVLSGDPASGGWRPHITYEFFVDGERHVSSRYSLLDEVEMSLEQEKALRSRLFVGGLVEVHYNPTSPGDSYVEVGSYASLFAAAVASVLLVTISVFCLKHFLASPRP